MSITAFFKAVFPGMAFVLKPGYIMHEIQYYIRQFELASLPLFQEYLSDFEVIDEQFMELPKLPDLAPFPLTAFYNKLDRQAGKVLTEASHEAAIDLEQLRQELYKSMGAAHANWMQQRWYATNN